MAQPQPKSSTPPPQPAQGPALAALISIGIRPSKEGPALFDVVKVTVAAATTDIEVLDGGVPYWRAEQSFIQAASNHIFPVLVGA